MIDSEKRLIQKAKQGDKIAFGKLVEEYHQKLLYVAYDLVGDYDEAKDLAQETFLRAYVKLSQFEERSKFSTWLYRILYNLSIDSHRKKKRNPQYSLEEKLRQVTEGGQKMPASVILQPGEDLERDETARQLDSALEKLTLNQRIAVVMRYYHQKSSKEISEVMGCAESTVRIHIFRALAHMRKDLGNLKPE
jgi:RNA polymerase sigma-70 factor, ECF subfamily